MLDGGRDVARNQHDRRRHAIPQRFLRKDSRVVMRSVAID